ncbi:MAG: MBL fold metallo-hydrolase [Bernardetiaceae bacterium]|nr:MBL fold metallo-hydrolase [Bernardetiaceae bacterium]
MIQVKKFTFNPFQENTYLLYDETKAAVVIDPGCLELHEQAQLRDFVQANSLKVEALINTHCHIDHVLGNKFIKETYNVALQIPPKEVAILALAERSAIMYGMLGYEHTTHDELLAESGTFSFGNSELEILFVPGHAPGHLAFYAKEEGFCINGDVLFRQSIGRTDLPGGDHDTLLRSIREVMFALPDNTLVYTGHGPETTIGYEKANNPFCAIMA